MTILLARAKTFPNLALLLCALLAWPANLPMAPREAARPGPSSAPVVVRRVGTTFQRPDRKLHLNQADWSDVADNLEGSDGRDDFRYAPPGLADRPTDLPSLVPSSVVALPPGPVATSASFSYAPPLRC